MRFSKAILAVAGLLSLSACASSHPELAFSEPPQPEVRTAALDELQSLPAPARKLTVAVYRFDDLTGQNKPNDNFSEYSRAVTQGGVPVLINALEKAGQRQWFNPVERSALPALLQERQIIRATRQEYGGQNLPPLPPLTYAGIILDGGIIGYDSNLLTGGFGARYLGVGGDVRYRRDTVTVYIRALSVRTGEILKSVSASKTIYSVAVNGSAFRFIGFKDLLEIESGITTNEPTLLATKQAIEKAVHAMVVEGLIDGYWTLKDPGLAPALVDKYVRQKDGVYDVRSITTTPQDQQPGVAVPQAPAAAPSDDGRASPESRLQPSVQPGLPPVPPSPTYVLPDGRKPIPGT